MEPLSREEKQQIVQKELFLLKEEKYISTRTYQEVIGAHKEYYKDLAIEEKVVEKQLEKKLKPQFEKPLKPQKVKPIKPAKSEEQIRERNITWLLNLGVILLLIGGLYVATSNWATMSNVTKAGSIGLVSLLFYGIAYVSKNVLHIEKTAFAFIVLGSLFLPIFLLSIGWFRLVGDYLSIFGEGRFLFGMLSSFIVLPVYILLARRLASRLFVWFSFLALTIGAGFLIASFRITDDSFYLGMMLFQGVFIVINHRLKANEKVKLFTKEFIYFAQVNLILTTVLMLALYHSNAHLGFNLILTAVIYMSMVYVTGKKEYHFVFSAMLVFGVYQFVKFSFLAGVDTLIFAALGFVFLSIPRMLDDSYPWKKVFTLTSGVVSALAFLFITFEAVLIRFGEPSFILLLSYIAIAGNFLYLSNSTGRWLFRYLTAVFLSVVFMEGLHLLNEVFVLRPFVLYVCLIGFMMFTVFGVYVNSKLFELIQQPARDVGWVYMGIAFYASLAMYAWWELGVILLIISMCAYISFTKESRLAFRPFGEWLAPVALGLGIVSMGEEWRTISDFYRVNLGIATHFTIAAVALLSIHLKWKVPKAFYVAQALYTFGLVFSLLTSINEDWVRPLLFIGGIGMYVLLFMFTKIKYVSYLVSVTTLIGYFTILYSVGEMGNLQFIAGAVLLFLIALIVKNRALKKAYAVLGHIYMPFAFLLTLFMYGKEAIWTFIIGLVIYGVSTKMVEREWQRKLLLYSAFSTLFVVFATGLAHFERIHGELAFLLTSMVITGFWFFIDAAYKKRTLYYLIPFSFFGILAFISIYPFETLPYVVSILYSIGVAVILFAANWVLLLVFPVIFIYGGTVQYILMHPFNAVNEQLALTVFGIVFLLAGKWFFNQLYEKRSVDVFSLGAILFFVTMFLFDQPTLWVKVLPGLLLALTAWMQRNRVPTLHKWVPTFMAGALLLQPYYILVQDFNIHSLLLMEVNVLPIVVLGIYLRICLKGKYDNFTSNLQWAVLVVVATILVIDGLETSTIYDALILGSLSLASLLSGVFLRIKSYFLIGFGVLLLNVFMQTRTYWGNLPWWAYLLLAGSILIGVASSNEWNKQKAARGENTMIATLKNKVIDMWRQWK